MHKNNASLGLITSINFIIPRPKSDLINIVTNIIQLSLKRDAFYLVQQKSLKKSLKQQFKMKNVKLKHKSALWLLENSLNRSIRSTCRKAFQQLVSTPIIHTNETTCSVSNSQLVTPKTSSKQKSYEERRLRQLSNNQAHHQQISQLEMILLLLILLLMKVYQK